MRQSEVIIGERYFARVNGTLCLVKITSRTPWRRGRLNVFEAENLRTGRRIRLTAARLLGRHEGWEDANESENPAQGGAAMNFFKVVRRTEEGALVSCATENPELMVRYKPGEWVEAPVGGLLVFSNWASADGFACGLHAKTYKAYEVWQCEAENEVQLPDLRVVYTDFTNAVRWLWSQVSLRPLLDEINLRGFEPWPTGTLAFRRVRLLEKCEKGGGPGALP